MAKILVMYKQRSNIAASHIYIVNTIYDIC